MATVFLSYRQENEEHCERVRALAQRLRAAEMDVILDRFYQEAHTGGPPKGWEIWSEEQAQAAEKILVVASKTYEDCYSLNHPQGSSYGVIPEALIIRRRVKGEGYRSDTVRVVVLDTPDVRHVPDPLAHLHLFQPNKRPGDFDDLVAWIEGRPLRPREDRHWLANPPDIQNWPIANCEDIRAAVAELLTDGSAKHILLIEGESGLGKSHLTAELAALVNSLRCGAAAARLDIKSGLELERLVEPFARMLGVHDCLRSLRDAPALRQLAAVFDSLDRRAAPALLIFDTFEHGGEYALWIRDHVMAAAASAPWLRVIVAGKETPPSDVPEAIAWRDSVQRIRLQKLEWEAWKPLARTMRPDLDDERLRDLHGIVHGSHSFIYGALRLGASS